MKRILCVLLALLLLAGLAGCYSYGGQGPALESSFELQVLPASTGAGDTREAPASTAAPAPETDPAPESKPADTAPQEAPTEPDAPEAPASRITEDGIYDSKEEVALYIHLYRHLPSNYITKKEAEKLGWPGGDLRPYAPGKCIGGSHFGNYEGLLPKAKGREWTECDIDTLNKKSRGAKRIIFSNDGLIYYTDDHYESFEQLYDGWED